MTDLHTHSEYSGDIKHGRGSTVRELCLAAVERGVTTLAVTDHFDIDGIYEGYFPPLDHESVRRDIMTCREEFSGRLSLLYGIELGQATHMPAEAEELLSGRDYDIVLGSVHAVRGIIDFADTDLVSLSRGEVESLWERYLSELEDTVRWGKFDILTHITYPKRYFLKQGITDFPDIASRGREYFEPVLRALIERGITLECNTSGLRQIMGECLPARDLLEFYYELGGRDITLGSDAHHARDIGAGIRESAEMLADIGFKHITVFKNRVKSRIGINTF